MQVDGLDFIRTMIAQDVVDVCKSLGEVMPPKPVDPLQALTRVAVVQGERPFVSPCITLVCTS